VEIKQSKQVSFINRRGVINPLTGHEHPSVYIKMIAGKGSNASQYPLMQPIGAKAVGNYRPMTEDTLTFSLGYQMEQFI
jgi:hypothetical protein